MKQISVLSIFVISLILINADQVTAQFKIDAQLRNRFEFRDGYQQLLPDRANPAFLISQRSRLSFFWQNKNLRIRFTPQDVRVWGDEELASSTGVFGDHASLDLFEGFAEIKAGEYLWISIGRQQLVYDNQRLLAGRNWNQLGISYDAVITKLNLQEWNLHIGVSWNNRIEQIAENPYDPGRIKTLNFLWLNRQILKNLRLSLIQMATGVTKTDSTNTLFFRQTSGFFAEVKLERFTFWADAYYQYGKNDTGNGVSAFLAGSDISYQIGKLTPGAGFTYISGNKFTGEKVNTDHLFDIFYGARHRFLGYMDYFRNIPSHTKQGGIQDFYAYLNLKINNSISIQDAGHLLFLGHNNFSEQNERALGFENDLVFQYKFNEWSAVEGGYLFLLPTETLRTIQDVKDSQFAQFVYLQLTFTPVMLQQKSQP
ncbi:MAG: alginate export family protein [Bacteroidetes bacterium]|nr:alginate export family protein [Bacteroidota bacterium]